MTTKKTELNDTKPKDAPDEKPTETPEDVRKMHQRIESEAGGK